MIAPFGILIVVILLGSLLGVEWYDRRNFAVKSQIKFYSDKLDEITTVEELGNFLNELVSDKILRTRHDLVDWPEPLRVEWAALRNKIQNTTDDGLANRRRAKKSGSPANAKAGSGQTRKPA